MEEIDQVAIAMPWWFITGMVLSAVLAILFIGGGVHMVMTFLRKLKENDS